MVTVTKCDIVVSRHKGGLLRQRKLSHSEVFVLQQSLRGRFEVVGTVQYLGDLCYSLCQLRFMCRSNHAFIF